MLRDEIRANAVRISETHFFCDFADQDHTRLSAAVLYVVVDGFIDSEGEETQEIAAIAYGYAGGQVQSDFLFRRDGNTFTWYYSDCSGGEWKGARTTPSGSHLYTEELSEYAEWSEQDQAVQVMLEGLWDDFFALDDNGDTTVSDYIFDKYKKDETSAHTDGFDMDVLWDISPITNFTTQYSDPYYA